MIAIELEPLRRNNTIRNIRVFFGVYVATLIDAIKCVRLVSAAFCFFIALRNGANSVACY